MLVVGCLGCVGLDVMVVCLQGCLYWDVLVVGCLGCVGLDVMVVCPYMDVFTGTC